MAYLKVNNPSKGGVSAACQKNNQWDVQSLSKLSIMYVSCLMIIAGLWQMRWFGNFGATKTKIQQQKGAVWHIISNPLDPTRTTNKDPPIPFLCWHGPQVMHLSTVHTNYMTCRYMLLLPGLELNMTFPFRTYKACPFHSDIKTSLTVRSMGWNLANLPVTAPNRTSSTLKMSPSCQGVLHHLNRPTMMSIRIPPTDEIDQASSSFLLGDERSTSLPFCFHRLYLNLRHEPGFLWHTEWQHLSPGEKWIGKEGYMEWHPSVSWLDSA